MCIEEIKALMSLNVLHFNDKKTEVMMFKPIDSFDVQVDLDFLGQLLKPAATNLDMKLDSCWKILCTDLLNS